MIGLISGTSEGKEILSLLNKYTDDILVSTATTYGGELLKDYKYKILNTTPINTEEMKKLFKINNINVLIDATHPYAVEVSKNAMKVCHELSIKYIRYERERVVDKFLGNPKVVAVDSYEKLYECLKNVKGTILNTTGSRNLDKILGLQLENRIVHRVLPSLKVIKECYEIGIKLDDLIAIKGPIGYELNKGFIKEYNAKAIILKDSGKEGGTEEKINAALDENIWVFIVDRQKINYETVFCDEKLLIEYLKDLGYVK